MKKLIAMTLAIVMAISLFAGCGKDTAPETTPSTTESAVTGPASALELMETVWGAYAEDEKFAVIGGSMAAPVDGAPGNYDLADENITYSLLIPADQLANVTEAASMIHMMNANTFTAAAFKLAEGVSAEAFLESMREAVVNNQWICGFPEILVTSKVTDEYVVVAFGAADLVDIFHLHQAEVYPQREITNRETLA